MNARPYIIAVSGIMGSGKTTLARGLAVRFGWRYVPEPMHAINYLPDLFRDPSRWAFETQLAFVSHKAIQIRNALRDAHDIILDRSLQEDYQVFAQHFYQQGQIDGRAFATYEAVVRHFLGEFPPPTLYLVCDCSIPTAMARIRERGRAYQQAYPPGHVEAIKSLYHGWMQKERETTYRISTEKYDWRKPKVLEAICEELECVLTRPSHSETQLELFSPFPVGGPVHELRMLEAPRQVSGTVNIGFREILGSVPSKTTNYPSIYVAAPFTGQAEVKRSRQAQATLFGLETAHGQLLPGRYRTILVKTKQAFRRSLVSIPCCRTRTLTSGENGVCRL